MACLEVYMDELDELSVYESEDDLDIYIQDND